MLPLFRVHLQDVRHRRGPCACSKCSRLRACRGKQGGSRGGPPRPYFIPPAARFTLAVPALRRACFRPATARSGSTCCSGATNRENDSTTPEDLDYDEFLSGPETTEIATATCKNPPPGITVTVHLDNNPKQILKTEHQQQLGNSFNHSNNDLHNVINVGHNARTVIINKREDNEEVKAYSPISNYQIPDIYGYNSQK